MRINHHRFIIITIASALLLAAPIISPAQNLFVANNSKVSEFAPNGTLLQAFSNPNIENPTGMTFDSQGNLYVVNFDSKTVEKLTTNGISLATLSGNNLFEPGQPAFDSQGNLFVVNYNLTNNIISKFDSAGTPVPFTTTSVTYPSGLAIDSNDNLFVANQGDNTVSEITPAGILANKISLGPNDEAHTPTCLTFDQHGVLYVSQFGNTISAIKDGVVTTVISSGLNNPAQLAFDNNGNLFVASVGTGTIVEYTNSAGVLSTNPTVFASGIHQVTVLAFQPAPSTSLGRLKATVTGDLLVITLPPGSSGSILESATNLSATMTWIPVFTNTSSLPVSVPLLKFPSSGQFFRLRD
jgi:streptogramin lyase